MDDELMKTLRYLVGVLSASFSVLDAVLNSVIVFIYIKYRKTAITNWADWLTLNIVAADIFELASIVISVIIFSSQNW